MCPQFESGRSHQEKSPSLSRAFFLASLSQTRTGYGGAAVRLQRARAGVFSEHVRRHEQSEVWEEHGCRLYRQGRIFWKTIYEKLASPKGQFAKQSHAQMLASRTVRSCAGRLLFTAADQQSMQIPSPEDSDRHNQPCSESSRQIQGGGFPAQWYR